MTRRLVIVGDALLDRDLEGRVERLSPDAPVPVVDDVVQHARPGGAGLAAALAAADGCAVTLVTALSTDLGGRELCAALDEAGVAVVDLGLEGPTPEKIRVRGGGQTLLRLDRSSRGRAQAGPLTAAALEELRTAPAVLAADYGYGVLAEPGVRAALAALARRTPLVWDPHPHGSPPVAGSRVATPNRGEAARFVPEVEGDDLPALAARARTLCARWEVDAVCITLGAGGALLASPSGAPLGVPAPSVHGGDPCGAGDRFAVRLAELLGQGASTADAVGDAVRTAAAFVAAGGAGSLGRPGAEVDDPRREQHPSAHALAARVRAAGGTVIAAGGCFDLLHAGHVAYLEAARGLGDCLVVCLNSNRSVRRLKGGGRPLVDERDRAAVLLALECVDAVAVFDEDTPVELLRELRPHVFAKGGDYGGAELPEAAALAGWGGECVVLPYVPDRSTTRLIEEVLRGR